MPSFKKRKDEFSSAKRKAISQNLPIYEEQSDEVTSTTQDAQMEMRSGGGATAATQGYRGAFVGETMDHPAYNEKHKEQIHITTRTATRHPFMWCSYDGAIASDPETYVPQNEGKDPLWLADEAIFTLPLNMYAGNFVDYKLLALLGTSTKAGYSKWKLNRIKVSIEFEHYLGSWVDNYKQYQVSDNEFVQVNSTEEVRAQYAMNPIKYSCGMYVYRDKYDEFSNSTGNINIIPTAGTGTGTVENKPAFRLKKFIQNEISSLTYVHPGEEFSFTREIGAKGAYYITPGQIATNFVKYSHFANPNQYSTNDVNIQTVINQLEGIQDQQGFIGTPLREGFNLLLAPDGAPFIPILSRQERRIYQPSIITTAWVRYEADWFGYDFTYGSVEPVRFYISDYDSLSKRIEYENKMQELKRIEQKRFVNGMGEPPVVDSDFIKY